MPTAPSNGIDLAYETFGDPSDPTVLLVMGLGAQMVSWDDGICALLVGRGFHVVRFDNRDIGQSTWIDTPGLDIGTKLLEALGGDTDGVPYLLSDMALDTVGLLDALDIEAAHLVGASMGGMIAQQVAIDHPSRVRSLTSIMSTPDVATAGAPNPDVLAALMVPPPDERSAAIEHAVSVQKLIGCAEHFDEDRARAVATVAFDRGANPLGVGRQLLAIVASGSREDALARLDLPALVVHGRGDQLIGFDGGQRTAELIAGADFLAIDDMAHDLPQVHWTRVVDAISAVAGRAA